MIDKKLIKTWFVTGASSGLGFDLCNQLIHREYNVIAISRNLPELDSPNALCISCDVNDHDKITDCIKLAIEKFGAIDVLVNNAGITSNLSIEEQNLQDAKAIMDTNFWASFNTMQQLIPHFREKKFGTIVNISSQSGITPRALGAAYVSSKHALEGLTSVAWWELQNFCRVLCVELGYFPGTNIGADRNDCTLYEEYSVVPPSPVLCPSTNKINNISKATKYIINEVEKEKMQRRLILGHEACYKINFEANMLLSDSESSFSRALDCAENNSEFEHYGLRYKPSEKSVGILNFQFENMNFGAILTSFALNRFINKHGYKGVNINYVPDFPWVKEEAENNEFLKFKAKYLPLTEKYSYGSSLNELNSKFSIFVVGSDQVWRQQFTNKIADRSAYFLTFANYDKKIMSCSASFGTDSLELINKRKKELFHRLSLFDFISVREKSGAIICKKIGVEAHQLLDPVFFLQSNEWINLANKSNLNKDDISDSISIYTINDELGDKFSEFICKNQSFFGHKKIINITKNISVEDWLFSILHSKFVITDSFHATCFSIIFNKQFLCINTNTETNTRLIGLLDDLKIKNRLYSDFGPQIIKNIELNPINYVHINEIIDRLANQNRNFFLANLTTPIDITEDRIDRFTTHKKEIIKLCKKSMYICKLRYLRYNFLRYISISAKKTEHYKIKSKELRKDYVACKNILNSMTN